MKDYRMAKSLISHNCFLATIDLQDAYRSIAICKEHRRFLKFRWQGKLYHCNCVPFGLSSAPFIFFKFLEPVMATLRVKQFSLVIFLDDILSIGNTFNSCKENVNEKIELLSPLGFRISFKKSSIIRSQSVKYLGFHFDSRTMFIRLPDKKVVKIKDLCSKVLSDSIV